MTLDSDQLARVSGGIHRFARRAGNHVGFNAGVLVTRALSHNAEWNSQVPGMPEGFKKRHESVIGPKVRNYANTLHPGLWQDFVWGVSQGATAAPRWTFREGM